MKWVICLNCKALTPVADDDDPAQWEEPCEVCGGRNWKVEMKKSKEIKHFTIRYACKAYGYLKLFLERIGARAWRKRNTARKMKAKFDALHHRHCGAPSEKPKFNYKVS